MSKSVIEALNAAEEESRPRFKIPFERRKQRALDELFRRSLTREVRWHGTGLNNTLIFCPFHENTRTPAMSVCKDGRFICHNEACGVKGGIEVLEGLLGLDPYVDSTAPSNSVYAYNDKPWIPSKLEMDVYKGFVDLASKTWDTNSAKPARDYLTKQRGITNHGVFKHIGLTLGYIPHNAYTKKHFNQDELAILRLFGIVYDNGNDVLEQRVMMMHPSGFIQARSIFNNHHKFHNSSIRKPVFIPPESDDPCCIVESPICGATMAMFGVIPAMTYGSVSSERLTTFISQSRLAGRIVFNALDMDMRNGPLMKKDSVNFCKAIAELPKLELTEKDPNDQHTKIGDLECRVSNLLETLYLSLANGEN